MVTASLADPVVVLRKIITPKILGILKTLIIVDQMAARQDIFVDLTASVIQRITVVSTVVHLVTTVDQTANVFHAHQADVLQTCKTILQNLSILYPILIEI